MFVLLSFFQFSYITTHHFKFPFLDIIPNYFMDVFPIELLWMLLFVFLITLPATEVMFIEFQIIGIHLLCVFTVTTLDIKHFPSLSSRVHRLTSFSSISKNIICGLYLNVLGSLIVNHWLWFTTVCEDGMNDCYVFWNVVFMIPLNLVMKNLSR